MGDEASIRDGACIIINTGTSVSDGANLAGDITGDASGRAEKSLVSVTTSSCISRPSESLSTLLVDANDP
jgi:hypothetical protein